MVRNNGHFKLLLESREEDRERAPLTVHTSDWKRRKWGLATVLRMIDDIEFILLI